MYLYVFNYQTIEILEIEYDGIKSPEDVLSEYNLDIDACQYMSSENKLNIENITKNKSENITKSDFEKIDFNKEYPIGTKLSTKYGLCIIEKGNICTNCIFKNNNNCNKVNCFSIDRQDKQSIIFKKI